MYDIYQLLLRGDVKTLEYNNRVAVLSGYRVCLVKHYDRLMTLGGSVPQV